MSEARDTRQMYVGVAIAFAVMAIGMGVALHNWAIALPFGVLAITFFIISRQPRAGDTPGDGDDSQPQPPTRAAARGGAGRRRGVTLRPRAPAGRMGP